MTTQTHPTCFDTQDQYDGWLQMLRSCGNYAYGSKTHGPCWDCSPEYQAEMVEQGRCEHPETQFRMSQEGLVGTWRKAPAGPERSKVLALAAERGISERTARRRLAPAG